MLTRTRKCEESYDEIWQRVANRKREDKPMLRSRIVSRPGRPKKTHCVHGHERTPENVGTTGGCNTCSREWKRRQTR